MPESFRVDVYFSSAKLENADHDAWKILIDIKALFP
jgi:hypothetical protein